MTVSNTTPYVVVQQKESRYLCVDSKNRAQGTPVDFQTQPMSVQTRGVALKNISFCYNTFLINQYSSTLVVGLNVYTLTQGNYTYSQLVNQLNSIQPFVTFSYSATTNKISCVCTVTTTLTFSQAYNNLLLGRILGFCSYSDVNIAVSPTSITAPFQINLTPWRYLDICSSSLCRDGGGSIGSAFSNVIARINIQSVPIGSVFEYVEQKPHIIGISPERGLGAIDFQIMTDTNVPLPLDNSCEVSMVFDLYM